MNILSWIILGLLSGAIAKAIVPGYQKGGWLSTLILGIVGAFVGGTLYSFFQTGAVDFQGTELSIGGVFVAVLGSILTIILFGKFANRGV